MTLYFRCEIQVLKAVKVSALIFWIVTPCGLKSFGEKYVSEKIQPPLSILKIQ
jgi:hypothetical protein